MATLDELLAELDSSGEEYRNSNIKFVIDENLRTTSIPSQGIVAGVTGDKNVNRVNFKMVRWYDGTDMSLMNIRINYRNAREDYNYYTVDDITIAEDFILFTWLVDSDAVAVAGRVTFCVYAFEKDDSGKVVKAFKSSNNTMNVLEGIDVDSNIEPEDIIAITDRIANEVLDIVTTTKDDAIETVTLIKMMRLKALLLLKLTH